MTQSTTTKTMNNEHTMSEDAIEHWPAWTQEIKKAFKNAESSIFIVHGNVDDYVLHEGQYVSLRSFIVAWMEKMGKRHMEWSPRRGLLEQKLVNPQPEGWLWGPQTRVEEVPWGNERVVKGGSIQREVEWTTQGVLSTLDGLLLGQNQEAWCVTLPHANSVFPSGDPSFWSMEDRMMVTTVLDWALDERMALSNHMLILMTPHVQDLPAALQACPRVTAVEIKLPVQEEREAIIRRVTGRQDKGVELLAQHTGGLKGLQIADMMGLNRTKLEEMGVLQEPENKRAKRKAILTHWLTQRGQTMKDDVLNQWLDVTGNLAEDDVLALMDSVRGPAVITVGAVREEGGSTKALTDAACSVQEASHVALQAHYHEEDQALIQLLWKRKKDLIEKECSGLIEFVDTPWGLESVGGQDGIKKELSHIAQVLKRGEKQLAPMGLLAVGPMGAGKTFVIKAFLKEAGIPGVMLKNFRSKWVGSTESNLEKVLATLKAMGPCALIMDEADRAFGKTEGEGDSGTQSRTIARLKEFMSDPSNRGQVLFIMMTNRPDKLDTDLKRPGRLDRKIPFFYAQTHEEIRVLLNVLSRRYGMECPWDDHEKATTWLHQLMGYSNADLEGLVGVYANAWASKEFASQQEAFEWALNDFMPPREKKMIEYMEALAVQEASRRGLLPKALAVKYDQVNLDDELLRLKQELHIV